MKEIRHKGSQHRMQRGAQSLKIPMMTPDLLRTPAFDYGPTQSVPISPSSFPLLLLSNPCGAWNYTQHLWGGQEAPPPFFFKVKRSFKCLKWADNP